MTCFLLVWQNFAQKPILQLCSGCILVYIAYCNFHTVRCILNIVYSTLNTVHFILFNQNSETAAAVDAVCLIVKIVQILKIFMIVKCADCEMCRFCSSLPLLVITINTPGSAIKRNCTREMLLQTREILLRTREMLLQKREMHQRSFNENPLPGGSLADWSRFTLAIQQQKTYHGAFCMFKSSDQHLS